MKKLPNIVKHSSTLNLCSYLLPQPPTLLCLSTAELLQEKALPVAGWSREPLHQGRNRCCNCHWPPGTWKLHAPPFETHSQEHWRWGQLRYYRCCSHSPTFVQSVSRSRDSRLRYKRSSVDIPQTYLTLRVGGGWCSHFGVWKLYIFVCYHW